MKNFLNIFASFAIITSAFAQAPEKPPRADNVFIELPDRRTFFSKTFYNASDNTYKTTIGAGYLHYLASDGTFKDIDTNPRLDEGGAYYIIDSGLYNVAFAAAIGQGNWDVAYEVPRPVQQKFRAHGKPAPPVTRIRWKVLSYGYFDQSRNRYQIIDYAKSVPPVVAGSAISYPEIFTGIDVRYACDNTRLKEEIVLSQSGRHSLPDPSKLGLSRNNSYFVVAMEYLLTPNNTKVVAKAANGRVPVDINKGIAFNGDEPIEFEDETGVVPFFFHKDYAHAIADSVTDFANRTNVKRIFYSLGGKYLLLVGVPWNWINSSPQGDLIIDPTTTAIGNDDVYLQDATNYGTNSSLIIGKSSGTDKRRTIIKFNVSSVPSSATVINAQMKLRYYGTTGSLWIDRSVQAHQVLKNWSELQADRDKRVKNPDTSWTLQYGAINGTDAKATMESTTLFKLNEFPVWKNWDLTTLTQNWVNGTVTNYGVILWATNEDTDGMNLWFRSSEYSDSNFHPKLEVTWSQTLQAVYFLKDHLGSIRATVLDSAGAPILGYDDYDPWGYPLAQRANPIPTAYLQGGSKNKFTGKEYDDEYGVNWLNLGARPYDPVTGRFFIIDPLWYKYPSLSPYNYAANNPIIYFDPDGKSIWTKIAKVAVKLYKTGDAASAFADNISDIRTLANPAASVGEKVVAAVSLASELAPVSVGDVKDVAKAIDKGVDVVKSEKNIVKSAELLTEKAGPVGQISPSEVIGKSPNQIDTRAKQLGLEAKGSNPAAGKGAYVDPQTGQQRILAHPNDPTAPHGHVNNPQGQRVNPVGAVVDPKSKEAHLPIKKEEEPR